MEAGQIDRFSWTSVIWLHCFSSSRPNEFISFSAFVQQRHIYMQIFSIIFFFYIYFIIFSRLGFGPVLLLSYSHYSTHCVPFFFLCRSTWTGKTIFKWKWKKSKKEKKAQFTLNIFAIDNRKICIHNTESGEKNYGR